MKHPSTPRTLALCAALAGLAAAVTLPLLAQERGPHGGPPPFGAPGPRGELAPGGPDDDGPGGPGTMARIADFLELTDAQRGAGMRIHEETRAVVEPLRAHAEATRDELRKALDATPRDAARIGALVVDLEETRDRIRAAHEDAKAKLAAQLDPAQRQRFETLTSWFESERDALRERFARGAFAGRSGHGARRR